MPETIAFRPNQRRIRAVKSLYEKTIAFVLQYIDEQKLREGDQLPTEAQLSALAGVSLVTVRRALSELSSQAVVRREQGRGTFVARPRVKAETTKIGGLRNGLHLDARSKLQTRARHGPLPRKRPSVWGCRPLPRSGRFRGCAY